MGFGLSALIKAMNAGDSLAALCLAGALVHILNHAFLKGSLFLAAGSVLRQTGTLDQDRLGGLMKRMPFTGALFAVNSFALAGLPPMTGLTPYLSDLTSAHLPCMPMIRSFCPFRKTGHTSISEPTAFSH